MMDDEDGEVLVQLSACLRGAWYGMTIVALLYSWVWGSHIIGLYCFGSSWVFWVMSWVVKPQKIIVSAPEGSTQDCGHLNGTVCWLKGTPCPARCKNYVRALHERGWNERNPGVAGGCK